MTIGLDLEDASRRQQTEYKIKATIQDIAGVLKENGAEWKGLTMTEMQRQRIARQIMSEVLGYNTAEIGIPVTFEESPYYDEEREKEIDKRVDDILAEIKAKRNENARIRLEAVPTMAPPLELSEDVMEQQMKGRALRSDPFEEAMKAVEKK